MKTATTKQLLDQLVRDASLSTPCRALSLGWLLQLLDGAGAGNNPGFLLSEVVAVLAVGEHYQEGETDTVTVGHNRLAKEDWCPAPEDAVVGDVLPDDVTEETTALHLINLFRHAPRNTQRDFVNSDWYREALGGCDPHALFLQDEFGNPFFCAEGTFAGY